MPITEEGYDLRITLIGIEPKVWRRILVPSRITLPKLHTALQAALGWTDSHLHLFVCDGKRYGAPDPDWDDEVLDERRKKLNALLVEPFASMIYEYDFGDGWEHEIALDECFECDRRNLIPVCIDGANACPPEDVGGPGGYMEFLKAVRNKKHPEHQAMVTWAGGYFEPEAFDILSTNVLLGRCFPKGI